MDSDESAKYMLPGMQPRTAPSLPLEDEEEIVSPLKRSSERSLDGIRGDSSLPRVDEDEMNSSPSTPSFCGSVDSNDDNDARLSAKVPLTNDAGGSPRSYFNRMTLLRVTLLAIAIAYDWRSYTQLLRNYLFSDKNIPEETIDVSTESLSTPINSSSSALMKVAVTQPQSYANPITLFFRYFSGFTSYTFAEDLRHLAMVPFTWTSAVVKENSRWFVFFAVVMVIGVVAVVGSSGGRGHKDDEFVPAQGSRGAGAKKK